MNNEKDLTIIMVEQKLSLISTPGRTGITWPTMGGRSLG